MSEVKKHLISALAGLIIFILCVGIPAGLVDELAAVMGIGILITVGFNRETFKVETFSIVGFVTVMTMMLAV